MSKHNEKEEKNLKNFNEILEDINKKQRDIVEKIQSKYKNSDDEKKKYKLAMLGILWKTYLLTLGSIEDKGKDFTMGDFKLIKSISLDEEKDKENYFIPIINTFQNLNLNKSNLNVVENNVDRDFYQANLIKAEKKKIDLKLTLNNRSKEEEKAKMETCIFCMEEFEENDIINPQIMECKKYVHGKCLINYVEEELNNNRFPIRCPLCTGKDRHEMNYKTILDCLLINDREDLVNKLENISLNYLAENNSDEVTFCPTAGCSYMCFYDKNEYRLNCPLCKKIYCLQCKAEWHEFLTCEEYQKQKKEEENDVKFEEYAKGSKLKQCPKCKRWVEKISGCDHITCTCGTHFCYKCGEIREFFKYHVCPNYIFGNNNNEGGIFGNNNNQVGSLFGNNNNQVGSLFGNNNNEDSIFGNNNNKGSIFSNNNNNQGDIFGNNNNKDDSLFHNNNNQSNSLFGNNNPDGNLFANNNNNPGVSLFANNNNQNSSVFAYNNNQDGSFI